LDCFLFKSMPIYWGCSNIGDYFNKHGIIEFNNVDDLIYQTINSGSSFTLNSEETISSDYVFVRVKNSEYNYTSNPSMIDVSKFSSFSNIFFISR
jgi:hypothetical protein